MTKHCIIQRLQTQLDGYEKIDSKKVNLNSQQMWKDASN